MMFFWGWIFATYGSSWEPVLFWRTRRYCWWMYISRFLNSVKLLLNQHTVDGRDPAPPGMYKDPVNNVIFILCHINWGRISFINCSRWNIPIDNFGNTSSNDPFFSAISSEFYNITPGTYPRTPNQQFMIRNSWIIWGRFRGCLGYAPRVCWGFF